MSVKTGQDAVEAVTAVTTINMHSAHHKYWDKRMDNSSIRRVWL